MTPKPWWELYPQKYKDELDALEQAGIKYSKDESSFAAGVLKIHLNILVDNQELRLYAVFPDLYPYFRFQVYAPGLQLLHHQNPLNKIICLIGRSSELWHTTNTLADVLTQRLHQVLLTGQSNDPNEVEMLEEQQAEPFSDYYSYEPGTSVIVDNEWDIDTDCNSGNMIIGVTFQENPLLNGAVLEVHDENGNIMAKSVDRITRAFSGGQLSARWIRLSSPLKIPNPTEIFNPLQDQDPFPEKIKSHRVKYASLKIRAALFPEENRNRRQLNNGWIFVCSYKKRNT